jgi:hypothetical protein
VQPHGLQHRSGRVSDGRERRHSGRATTWKGKWGPDLQRTVAQAKPWRAPVVGISIVGSNGLKAALEEWKNG